MGGFGCFIVTLLSCLNLRLFLISEGYCSQARDAERQEPQTVMGDLQGDPPRLKDLSQVATSQPEHVPIVSPALGSRLRGMADSHHCPFQKKKKKVRFTYSLFVHMAVLLACAFVYHVRSWRLQRSENGIRSPRTRVMGGCEPRLGLGMESESSSREANSLNHQAISSAPAPSL